MNFELFKTVIKDNVSRKMGNEYQVTITDVRKNNGVVWSGLTIKKDDINIAPVIYLDGYYEMYTNGRYTIYEAVNSIMKMYKENMPKQQKDLKFLVDFETARPFIIHKLINKESNQELLEGVPHVDFLDLSIIFLVMLPEDEDTHGFNTITITNEYCKIWEIGVDELVFSAKRNTPRLLPNSAKNIEAVIKEFMNMSDLHNPENIPELNDSKIMVLSNIKNIDGAVVMLDKNFLRECSDNMNGSYYILPSSIHEILAIPDDDVITTEALKDMVKCVNDTELNKEDILSYSVYYFDRENDKLLVL